MVERNKPVVEFSTKQEPLVAVKWRERPSTPSIYPQRLFMGPKYNAATSLEELGSTKTYRKKKRALKRVKVPNLAQATKQEQLVAVKERERRPPLLQYMPKGSSWVPNTMLQQHA